MRLQDILEGKLCSTGRSHHQQIQVERERQKKLLESRVDKSDLTTEASKTELDRYMGHMGAVSAKVASSKVASDFTDSDLTVLPEDQDWLQAVADGARQGLPEGQATGGQEGATGGRGGTNRGRGGASRGRGGASRGRGGASRGRGGASRGRGGASRGRGGAAHAPGGGREGLGGVRRGASHVQNLGAQKKNVNREDSVLPFIAMVRQIAMKDQY